MHLLSKFELTPPNFILNCILNPKGLNLYNLISGLIPTLGQGGVTDYGQSYLSLAGQVGQERSVPKLKELKIRGGYGKR